MLGEDHRLRGGLRAVAAALAAATLAGCGSTPAPAPPPSTPASAPLPTPTHAAAAPTPQSGTCHVLTYHQAVQQTAPGSQVPCARTHTAQTYAVGNLDDVVDGHLLSVDSARVQKQVASACPAALPTYLGASANALRLSMLRPVWFTPTGSEAAAGARWYRCDVVLVDGATSLAPLHGSLKGALASSHAMDYAMCGTAKPGTSGFQRVPCRSPHTWRALSVVPLPAGRYPGVGAVAGAGTQQCQQAAKNVASDPLNFQWGYDWPSAQQWAAGQTYGVCWAPA